MARKNQVVVLGLVLVAIASVVMLISWSGDDSNIVRELEEEPTLTVYVNETGEIKQMKLEDRFDSPCCAAIASR